MTASAPAAPAVNDHLVVLELALERLIPTTANTRPTPAPGDPELAELAQSIADMGVLQPIVVRPYRRRPEDIIPEGCYEILAGERRWRASKLAGKATIPARVLDVDDARAARITVIENLQRKDLTALEECRGVALLLSMGSRVEEIAASIGRSEKWVVLRARVAELNPDWLKAIATAKHPASALTIGHLELVARLPAEVHGEVLRVADRFVSYDGRPLPIEVMRDILDNDFLNDLRHVGWDLADETLVPQAGACSGCPKRSSCQQTLFQELGDDHQVKGKKRTPADRCLDRVCFQQKAQAFIARRKSEVAEQLGPETKVLTVVTSPTAPGEVSGGEVRYAKPGDKDARPAIVTVGKDAGKLVHVKPESFALDDKRVQKAFDLPGAEKRGPGRPKKAPVNPAIERKMARRKHVLNALAERAQKRDCPRPKTSVLLRMVLLVGFDPYCALPQPADLARFEQGVDAGGDLTEKELKALWEGTRHNIHDFVESIQVIGATDAGFARHASIAAVAVGMDFESLMRSAEAEHPEAPPGGETPAAKSSPAAKRRVVKKAAVAKAKKGKT